MDEILPEKKVRLRVQLRTRFPDDAVKVREEEMIFVYGVEPQVPTLDKALEGRRPGETVHLTIPPSEIYGAHDPNLIVEIPKKGLIKQRLQQGQYYRQMKMGSLVSFKVLEIRPHTILADLNRPLTGIAVVMDAEVLEVRDATPEEIREAREAHRRQLIGCS
jgi:FKBP-type peptidyl-prolyl cis-trans isomerase SlyD